MNNAIKIREFRYPEDFSTVYDLWASAGDGIHLRKSDEPDEIRKKLLRDPELFLLAICKEQVVGTVMGGYDGRRGMVYHLAVMESHRNQGIGNMLMSELENRLRKLGCIRCYLLVTPGNVNAKRFYANLDWDLMDLDVYGKDLI